MKTTSWREVYSKLRVNGMMAANGNSRGSDDVSVASDTGTGHGTPNFPSHHRPSLDQEWQMNYIINRRDGL